MVKKHLFPAILLYLCLAPGSPLGQEQDRDRPPTDPRPRPPEPVPTPERQPGRTPETSD
jgi:hypothetical protein